MKRALFLALLAALPSCSGEPAPPPAPVRPAPARVAVAQLSELRGQVWLTRDGGRAAARGGPVYEGDLLETGADGHALLKADQREVELLEDSRFRVGSTLSDLTLSLGELQMEELDAGRGRTVQAGERFVMGLGELRFEDIPQTPPPPEQAVAAKPKVRLTPLGAVKLKPKSEKEAPLAAAGRELEESGTFSVGAQSRLRAESEGAVLEFDPRSQGSLEPRAEEPKLRAKLALGGARLFLQAGRSVLLEGKTPLTVRAKVATTVLVRPGKAGPVVEVLGGELEVATPDGLPRLLQASELATPKGKGLDTGKRAAPALALQPGRSTRVYWSRPKEVELNFSAGAGLMEVAADPQFRTLLVAAHGGESLTVPAPLRGALYWRRQGETEVSSARFEREDDLKAVGAKPDVVAETGLKATVYFQGAVPTLTLTFPPKDGAASWRLRVYASNNLGSPVVDRRVNENRAVLESGTLKEGSYLWSAVAIDKADAEMSGGRMNKMDIVFDNSLSQLLITSPRKGERSATAKGIAPLGSRLWLNGKSVPLDAGGRFSVPLGGARLLVFKLLAKDGTESQWVRRVPGSL